MILANGLTSLNYEMNGIDDIEDIVRNWQKTNLAHVERFFVDLPGKASSAPKAIMKEELGCLSIGLILGFICYRVSN